MRPAARALGGEVALDRLEPASCEAELQLTTSPQAAAADLVDSVARLRTVTTETIQVTGIRCERCVMRLAKVLEGADGLESANANLMGQVQLVYDDERTIARRRCSS